MNKTAAILWMWLLAVVPDAVLAQPVFKCLDGRSVTYSSTPCEELGLKRGGEIRDRVTTVPAVKRPPPADPAAQPQKPPLARTENDADLPKTSTLKPVNPLVDKLAK